MIFRIVTTASIFGTAVGYVIALFIAFAAASPPTSAASMYVVALAIPWILTIFCLNRKLARDYPRSFFRDAPMWTKILAVSAIAVTLASQFGEYYIGGADNSSRWTEVVFYLGVAAMWCLLLPVIYSVHHTPDPS